MERSRIGNYLPVKRLTTGGPAFMHLFATRADEPNPDPEFFIKMVQPSSDAGDHALMTAQFEHELQLMKALNHPNVPSVLDDGEEDGLRYYVTERVIGVDLATLLGHRHDEVRSLSAPICVYLMAQVTNALVALHGIEVLGEDGEPAPIDALHRDICPANVLLSTDGDVLLTDLGSASSAWLAREHTVRDVGARAYMAPERVISGGEATVATDLFGMAVMLWEMLRGERCLRGADDLRTMENIARFEITNAQNRISGLSPRLNEVVRRNLDKDPNRRFATSYQMLSRLSQARESEHAASARQELGQLVAQAAQAMDGAGG